jgi:hypothetical protein
LRPRSVNSIQKTTPTASRRGAGSSTDHVVAEGYTILRGVLHAFGGGLDDDDDDDDDGLLFSKRTPLPNTYTFTPVESD